jgi:hypothetical protein
VRRKNRTRARLKKGLNAGFQIGLITRSLWSSNKSLARKLWGFKVLLKDKIALVTGSTHNIGLGVASAFAREGAKRG